MRELFKNALGASLVRVSRYIMNRRSEVACKEAETTLARYLPRVSTYLETQRAENGLFHDHTHFKLLELAQQLERLCPQTILECGSGATTCVFAEYARKRPGTIFVSVDNGLDYLHQTRVRLDPELRGVPIFAHCERRTTFEGADETCWYEPDYEQHFPDKRIDLCYIDGPYNSSPTNPGTYMACTDIVRILDAGFHVNHVLFDNRQTSVRYLQRSKHALSYDSVLHHTLVTQTGEKWVVAPFVHHSHFWLRSRARG